MLYGIATTQADKTVGTFVPLWILEDPHICSLPGRQIWPLSHRLYVGSPAPGPPRAIHGNDALCTETHLTYIVSVGFKSLLIICILQQKRTKNLSSTSQYPTEQFRGIISIRDVGRMLTGNDICLCSGVRTLQKAPESV